MERKAVARIDASISFRPQIDNIHRACDLPKLCGHCFRLPTSHRLGKDNDSLRFIVLSRKDKGHLFFDSSLHSDFLHIVGIRFVFWQACQESLCIKQYKELCDRESDSACQILLHNLIVHD